MNAEGQYLRLLQHLLDAGQQSDDRTGTGTLVSLNHTIRHHFEPHCECPEAWTFPLLTSKRVFWRGVCEELFWMLRGSTNERELSDKGIHIWSEWADRFGHLGPVYGAQWRAWAGTDNDVIDQVKSMVGGLLSEPESRRHIVTAWNPADIDYMALPPCHLLWQCNVLGEYLHLTAYQRSADIFLGVPFNLASYSLLTMLLAQQVGLKPGSMTWFGCNVHLYTNHVAQARLQTLREPPPGPYLRLHDTAFSRFPEALCMDDVELIGYNPLPKIKAEVAV